MEDFTKKFITALFGYAVQRDLSIEKLCNHSVIDYEAFDKKANYIITSEQMNSLWKNASHLSGDDLFGLHFGESMQLAALGIVGQIIQTSNTVGEALTHAGGMIHLITDMFQLNVHHGKETFMISLIADKEKAGRFPFTYRHMADYLAAFVLHELDGLLLKKMNPISVSFPYFIATTDEYERIFRCPIHKKQGDVSIELSSAYLSLPIITADYDLQQQLLLKAGTLQQTGDGEREGTLQQRIYHYLITNSYLYTLSLEAVAANFNMSPRTLQRKLKEEGASFLVIVEEVRKTLAINYLDSGNFQVKEVAYILGYNESSAFVRAFKRWTGKTPAEYKSPLS